MKKSEHTSGKSAASLLGGLELVGHHQAENGPQHSLIDEETQFFLGSRVRQIIRIMNQHCRNS